jgi:hypothetical protein
MLTRQLLFEFPKELANRPDVEARYVDCAETVVDTLLKDDQWRHKVYTRIIRERREEAEAREKAKPKTEQP